MHHLTAIVEDMRKDGTAGTFDMNIVGTRIANMKVVGADGVCVSQTNQRIDLCSFEGISTTVSEMRILNVSSLPGEVKEASSLFWQRMVGCGIWGSNNHLSGTVLRDVNGGGSFLCSNSTFDWCHSTSSERPWILPASPPTINHLSFPTTHGIFNEDEPEDNADEQHTDETFDGKERFNIADIKIVFTGCQFTNMKYTFSSSTAQLAGGSAIYLRSTTSSTPTTLSLHKCTFSKCSVNSSSTVYGGCVYLYNMRTSTNTIDACSFDDWYPSIDGNTRQYGGGIGTYDTSAPLVITDSNFTLSGTKNQYNGGFVLISSQFSHTISITITNSRFVGDSTSTGHVMYLDAHHTSGRPMGFISVTDSLILNTNSTIEIFESEFQSSGFTRTEITDTSIKYSMTQSKTHPHLVLDCKLNDSSICSHSTPRLMLLFSGTTFTGKSTNTSRPIVELYSTSHVIFHKCDFTDCSVASSQNIIYSYKIPSLVVDTCSFTRCSGGQSVFSTSTTHSFFYFCTFTNVTGRSAFVMTTKDNYAFFFESCRFELETADKLDFVVSSDDVTCLNETTMTGCSSNRQMYFGTSWTNRKELPIVLVIPGEVSKNEMKVRTWPTNLEEPADEDPTEDEDPKKPVPIFLWLSDALGNISTTPPLLDTVITFSDGSFTEDTHLEVSQIVEISGAGSNISEIHSTQLKTDGLVSKSTGKLTLQSLRLVPSLATSFLGSSKDSASLCVLNVIVEDVSEHSACLFLFAAGSCEIRHSFFKNIESLESLICVSGTSSLAVTNTIFVTIQRTSSKPTPVESIQCASCIEGKTSGEVQVLYCRFGACTTKGRAGAIDLENYDVTSTFEIGNCSFDRNSAGEGVPDPVRGDDVVLKSFDDSKLTLDLSTIQSFPSVFSFLINSEHSIVPPPACLWMTPSGVDDLLTWSYDYKRISDSFLKNYTLQFLLGSRLWNNIETQIKTDFYSYKETMTPFLFQNSTVSVSLYGNTYSIITVDPKNEVFITLKDASLSFNYVQFVFDKLTTPAIECDDYSSIEIKSIAIEFTSPILTHPFIESTGRYVTIEYSSFLKPITLENTPFVRLNRTNKDAHIEYSSSTPLLAGPLTVPFIVCEGAKEFRMDYVRLNSSFENTASFIFAKDSTVKLTGNKIQLLKSTAQGAFLHLENGTVNILSDSSNSSSGGQGGLIYCRNSAVNSTSWNPNSCSATQGGVLYSVESSLNMSGGYFMNCQADEGEIAYVVSSTLAITSIFFISNSAKRGGVFWVDSGKDSTSSLSWERSTFTANSAHDVDENGVDCGKGGAIFVKGTTSSKTAIDLSYSHFEENTAGFGNDVFLEETVLGGTDSTRLKNYYAGSYSRLPHLEIENHNHDDAELHRISDFLPFPALKISTSTNSTLTPACKWEGKYCRTLNYALQFLQTQYQNESLFQRKCFQYDNPMTTEPIVLEKQDLIYASYSSSVTSPRKLSLSATCETKEGVVFTINDGSRLTIERIDFSLTHLHRVVMVHFQDGHFTMKNCFIRMESGKTTSISPICSAGSSLILKIVTFSTALSSSKATLSAPLVSYTPEPSGDDKLGSGSFELINFILTNLTFEGTTMIEVKSTGDVTFTTPTLTNVISNQNEGKYLRLKGQNFKTQLKPKQWDDKFKTLTHVTSLWGEDISMDEKEKWGKGPLVYWLVSPSSEVVIGVDEDAVDHPNCGSSTFKCTTLDSAFSSARLNMIDTISFSVSTTLSTPLSIISSLTLKSFSKDRRTITFDSTSLMKVDRSTTALSLSSLIFTIAESCSSATLFVVEKGEMKFSSCLIGSSDNSSPLVVPVSTTKLIEVNPDGTLTLIETLIQHITFTHATVGTALHLHVESTYTFTGTSEVGEISSLGRGSHVVISSSTGLESASISSLVSQIEPWRPSTTNGARFTQSEIDEFVVIDSNEEVEELIYRWHPYDDLTLFVDRSGGSHSNCGLSSLPCSSLSSNLEKLGTDEVIKVCSALDETAKITTTRDLSIMSSDTSKKEIRVSESCSFTSIGFTLSFTSISFVPLPQPSNQNPETNTRSESLFIVESGSLSLTSCSVSSFTLSSSPLITHTSGTLTLQSCSVSSITRSTGNGTVLSPEMETWKSLLLDEIEFSSMSSSKDSPILALSFPPFDNSNPDPLFDFALTNLHFNSMTGMESDSPCFISLVGHDLASWISVGDDRFNNSYSDDSPISALWSVDETIDLSASLLFYLLPSSGLVGVSSSGYEMAKCGSNSVWCSTIELSLTRLSAQNTKKIVVMDEVTLSSSIALPDELTFAGNPTAVSACVVSSSGSLVSEDIDFTTISKLTFCLPSTQTAEAVIVHSSTKLTLSNLELSSTSESSTRFLKVTAGRAEMSDIEIRSEMTSDSILFWILGGSVAASQFRVETGIAPNGTIVQVEGGSLSLTGVTATSLKPIEGRLFSVTNAAFNVSDLKLSKQTFTNALLEMYSFGESTISDLNISECSGWTILTVRDGDSLTIRNSVFSSLTAPAGLNFVDSSDLCVWERSLIEIEGTQTSLSNAVLTHIPHGAISISDAPLTLSGCTFSSNSPSNLEWPSLRRNVKCVNGTVSMTGIGSEDGHSSPHLWMWTSECSVMKDDEIEHSPLFVPTLSNKSSSKFDHKQKEYSIVIVGTMMIPCGLSLEVFEAGFESKSNSGQPLPFEISSLSPSKWIETELSFVLPQSSLLTLDKNLDHRCRLVFGDGQTTDSFSLIGNRKGNMAQGGVVTTIVVPIVVVILVALLLIIILIVLCRHRKMKKNASEKERQELDTTDAVDVMKDDGEVQGSTIKPIMGTSTERVHEHSLLMISQAKEQDRFIPGPEGTPLFQLQFGVAPHVEAVRCDEKEGVVHVDPRNTLYHRLHVEKKVDFNKKQMAVRITRGLERMLTTSPFSEVFTRLSPHWIILDQSNNVFLRIDDLPNQISYPKPAAACQSKNGEDRRWNAPEQDTEEGNEVNVKPIDQTKVSVFRLGLILWELETELVPFGELDAVNASRQMKAGVMPLIHNWADESFVD
ncbi:hypothetical protein BLNAU_22329 [Blattamonas nauphoetae]|uniref:Uncharacterized protein n=1 Tax=Blattamonas nauphoetae TaxID=2049346 RepID=A0ABQ9WTB0_9EUKA|nr:hypothetical protein BLNAU_22329 [Blattamonas nauphoetae]